MNLLRWHLWREWREHRMALLLLVLVLPLVGSAVAHVPPKKALADPLIQSGAALAFVIVMLVSTGGELLGVDRRARGLQWLERLPSGLGTAFLAKLLFLALATAVAAVYGLGVARTIALLRGVEPRPIPWEARSFFAAVTLVAWTFACSAWALRGGVSILAAALVLAVIGYPVWRVVDAGYSPLRVELVTLGALLVPGALLGAWLAFVRGARFGRGTRWATFLGLAPVVPLVLATTAWSALRMHEREVFDPFAENFRLSETFVTDDGRTAFVVGQHELQRWNRNAMPMHALRIDLLDGSFEDVGRFQHVQRRYREEDGFYHLDELVITVEGHELPLVYEMAGGRPRAWDARKKSFGGWSWKGLGLHVCEDGKNPAVIRDPFRKHDYPVTELGDVYFKGRLLVRPGRWLHSSTPVRWDWLDPDTKQRVPVEWPEHSEPLVLFTDGRILLANSERGLQLVHPEKGLVTELDTQGVAVRDIVSTWNCARVPLGPSADAHAPSRILLRTIADAWLILDAEATSVRRLPVPRDLYFVRWDGEDAALVLDWDDHGFARLDLESGELTMLWPRTPAN